MRTEYRKKPPYYGKYKYKIELNLSRNVSVSRSSAKQDDRLFDEILKFLDNSVGIENYKTVFGWSHWRRIYLTTEDKLLIFLGSKYGILVEYLYKPAPGFENKTKKDITTPGKNALWYGRYPYKVILEIEVSVPYENEVSKIESWCQKNCFGSYRKSGYTGNVSFFFVNPIDATGFKLMFSEQAIKTEMPKKKIAEKLLRDRIKEARADLKDFLEGDTS